MHNKQYDFTIQYIFPDECVKAISCSLFLHENNIYIVSFLNGQKFTKSVYNQTTKKIVNFENYLSDMVIFFNNDINLLTSIYIDKIKNEEFIVNNFNNNFNSLFNLKTPDYSIDRVKLRYSFIKYEMQSKDTENLSLYKNVHFYSNYRPFFNSQDYLDLHLFRNGSFYWYCISTDCGEPICKFVFEKLDLPSMYLFKLVHREDYLENSHLIIFDILKNDFGKRVSTSYEMHIDEPDEKISFFDSCRFGFLSEIFENDNAITLSINNI